MSRHPARYRTRSDAARPFAPPSHTASPLDKSLEYAWQRASQPSPPDLTTLAAPEITPLNVLLSTQLPAPQWVIPDVLPTGITLLTGKQGVGKSLLALKLAIAIATNAAVLGQMPIPQGNVLYLALEENRTHTLERAAALLEGKPAPDRLEWAENWHPLPAGGLADIEDWLDTHDTARLVVIDSLSNVYVQQRGHSRYSNRERDSAILFPLKIIAAMHSVAIIVIHHLRRVDSIDCADEASNVPGSIDMTDCTLLLKREQTTQEITLRITGKHMTEKILKVF